MMWRWLADEAVPREALSYAPNWWNEMLRREVVASMRWFHKRQVEHLLGHSIADD